MAIADIIKSIGKAGDQLFTSDEERAKWDSKILQLLQHSDTLQLDISKTESASSNIFKSGWRPLLGWICGAAVLYEYIVAPIISAFGYQMPHTSMTDLITLLMILLGQSSLRTFEKYKGLTK